MKKKILTLILVCIMTLSVIACGSNGQKETLPAEATEAPTETPEAAVTETPAEIAEKVETGDNEDKKSELSAYIGKPLTEIIAKVDELGYTATYFADGVDFTDFINDMKDSYLTGNIKEDAVAKSVEVTLQLASNGETDKIQASLNGKLEEGSAWVAANNYGKELYGNGFDLNYLIGKITASAENESTWFLKAECTVDGAEMTCEAYVTGTTDSPEVTDLTIY